MCLIAVVAMQQAMPILATADEVPACAPPAGAQEITYDDAPKGLMSALRAHAGNSVGPHETFDSTDLIVTGIRNRIIFIWRLKGRWVVASEHGGLGYNNPIYAFDQFSGSEAFNVADVRIAFPRNVCEVAAKMLNGSR